MAKSGPGFLNIKKWAEEDRPREKLLLKGKASLSDAELIAILIGTGTASQSAVDLAKQILLSVDNNLDELAKLSVADLTKIKGIGEAKAIAIVSALELGRRRKDFTEKERPKINSSRMAFEEVKADLLDLPQEEFWILLLNRATQLIKKQKVSVGGMHATYVDAKVIFKYALEAGAGNIILAHNHPSGNSTPSPADLELTRKLKEGGKLLDIQLIDHIIVAGKSYLSFADEGLL
ncbi:MAG: DNA repair protein RadC [Cyclobacteriaceae bacterium]|nr:DNA repair protein RadC [Cyclobacteriaceae bacterium]